MVALAPRCLQGRSKGCLSRVPALSRGLRQAGLRARENQRIGMRISERENQRIGMRIEGVRELSVRENQRINMRTHLEVLS